MPWETHATPDEVWHLRKAMDAVARGTPPGLPTDTTYAHLPDAAVALDARGRDRCCGFGVDGNPCLAPAEVEGARAIGGFEWPDRPPPPCGMTLEEFHQAAGFDVRVPLCRECYSRLLAWEELVCRRRALHLRLSAGVDGLGTPLPPDEEAGWRAFWAEALRKQPAAGRVRHPAPETDVPECLSATGGSG